MKEKLTRYEQPRQGERNVWGANQVAKRFLEIFPKAKRGTQRKEGSKNYEVVLLGLKFLKS